ncbi:splicing regulatory glutamine/lysine-rich protein 1-like [Penaeus indicus]|uniref:splicing regulatory glutamine/lysine-rich protein 1-like n=1 Tax=Penaeus indicus TaxID=29960 RepID=UPI00300C2CBE
MRPSESLETVNEAKTAYKTDRKGFARKTESVGRRVSNTRDKEVRKNSQPQTKGSQKRQSTAYKRKPGEIADHRDKEARRDSRPQTKESQDKQPTTDKRKLGETAEQRQKETRRNSRPQTKGSQERQPNRDKWKPGEIAKQRQKEARRDSRSKTNESQERQPTTDKRKPKETAKQRQMREGRQLKQSGARQLDEVLFLLVAAMSCDPGAAAQKAALYRYISNPMLHKNTAKKSAASDHVAISIPRALKRSLQET